MRRDPAAKSNRDPEDISYESDSNDTVILGDDEPLEDSPKKPNDAGISFIRFISFDANATTDGDLGTVASTDVTAPQLTTLPSGLSFLQSHPYILSDSALPRGSFMFTDCRLQMAADEERSRHTIEENETLIAAPMSSESESNSCSAQDPSPTLPSISPLSAGPIPIRPAIESPRQHQFLHLTDKKCKNREAARKCRQKKKNYIQQLEHDFKELKVKFI